MIYNQDCMEAMKEMSDNQFDLAIVDPPYGIGADKKQNRLSKDLKVGKRGKYKKYKNSLESISTLTKRNRG